MGWKDWRKEVPKVSLSGGKFRVGGESAYHKRDVGWDGTG